MFMFDNFFVKMKKKIRKELYCMSKQVSDFIYMMLMIYVMMEI